MSTETPVDPRTRTREQIPEAFTWNLADIYASWDEWEDGLNDFES
jgi:oligoendopeptidase F